MFLVGILGYKIGEKIKLNKEFVDSIENYNSNEVSEENKNEQTNEVDENKEIAERYDDNEEHDKQTYEESYDIENDYLEKEKSIGKVLTKGQGFFRYYSALISTLRSYDINNIDNARVVYRLSDELLNNMYQTFKNDWNKEDFDKCEMMDFEFLKIPVPVNYHAILSRTYGDYMKFVIGTSLHGNVFFDTDKSYTEYTNR